MFIIPSIRCSFSTKQSVAAPVVPEAPRYTPPSVATGGSLLWLIDTMCSSSVYTDAARTSVVVSGSRVAGITDFSGNNNHWHCTASAYRPVYMTNAGLKCMDYGTSGTASMFFTTKLTTVRTAFWVMKSAGGSLNYTFPIADAFGETYTFHGGETTKIFDAGYASIAAEWVDTTKSLTGANDRPTTWKTVAATTTTNAIVDTLSWDRMRNNVRSWKGWIVCSFGYDGVMSDADIGTVLSNMKTYYGI